MFESTPLYPDAGRYWYVCDPLAMVICMWLVHVS